MTYRKGTVTRNITERKKKKDVRKIRKTLKTYNLCDKNVMRLVAVCIMEEKIEFVVS